MYKLISKYHNLFFTAAKILVSIGALVFLWSQREHWLVIGQGLKLLSVNIVFILLLFTWVNWLLEIKKWQVLTQKVEKLSFVEAARQSLVSFSVSLLTPNRVGDYGAKALFYKPVQYKKIWQLTFVGHTSQLIITLLAGGFSLGLWYFTNPAMLQHYHRYIPYVLAVFFLLISIGLWIKLTDIKHKTGLLTKSKIWQQGIFFSTLRFIVFSTQFVYILQLFPVQWSYLHLYPAVFTGYLLASLIPMLSFLDWVVKGSVSIWVFSFLHIPAAWVLETVAFMWLLNFFLPFVAGWIWMWFRPKKALI